MSNYLKIEPDDEDDPSNARVQPKKIAIARLIAACYLDQEAALLNAAPIPFDHSEEVTRERRIVAKIVARLRARAEKLRGR